MVISSASRDFPSLARGLHRAETMHIVQPQAVLSESLIDCTISSRPRSGESENGDAAISHRVGDIHWVVVVDGLGHGLSAKTAANISRSVVLSIKSEDLRVIQLFARLHDALKSTRGAAATAARFDPLGVEFGGIGNVSLAGLGGLSLPFVPTGGVLGGHCDPPRSRRVPLSAGDQLLLATDGVSRRAPLDELSRRGPLRLVGALMDDYGSEHDDTTVVHVTYHGAAHSADARAQGS
jgi:hypothetical protein